MKKKLHKISGYFKVDKIKNDQRIIVYMICVLIATVLWFLNALSKDYSTTISYPVKYVSAPKKQFLTNEPPTRLDLKVEAHGFTLLRHKLNLSFSPIVLNVSSITQNIVPIENDYSVKSNNLIRAISKQISNEIKVTAIQPEIIHFILDSLKTKLVPVKAAIKYSFKPQFNLKHPLLISPSEVEITGASEAIDTIQQIVTESISVEDLDNDFSKSVSLILPPKVSVKPEKVTVTVEVEKFTEKELKIPVRVKNKPDDVQLKLFPSEIKITVLTGLSEFENLTPDKFEAFVEYNSISTSSENLEVFIEKKPANTQILRISPNLLEYLIETNQQ